MLSCRSILYVAFATLASACGGSAYHQGQASGELATRLFFTNESLDQAAIYVARTGLRPMRIGTVMPGQPVAPCRAFVEQV